MTLRPLYARILVDPDPRTETTPSGLVLAEDHRPEGSGRIVAIGGDVQDLAIGERVVFSWTSGQEAWVDERKVLIMDARDVLAVVEGGDRCSVG